MLLRLKSAAKKASMRFMESLVFIFEQQKKLS